MPAGRPRSEAAREAILFATRDELAVGGYDRLSLDKVAVRAGVAKQTVYRWYPSKNSLIAECFLRGFALTPSVTLQRSDSVHADILAWMEGFAQMTEDARSVALIRAASAAAAEDPAVARQFQLQMNALARQAIVRRLKEAEGDGALRPGLPAEAVAEIIVGSLIYRLFTHEQITAQFVQDLAGTIFNGVNRQ